MLELRERIRAEYRAGYSILAFPEGTRTHDGRLGQLQPGMFRIAQQLEAAIVPVTVTGLYHVLRRGSWIIRPGQTITVHCDAPIETRGTGRGDLLRLVEQVSATMNGHLDAYWRDERRAPAPTAGPNPRGAALAP